MPPTTTLTHSTRSSGLADVLERVLDKGVVVAGDIRIKIVDIELLTIQIRLVVASVDKARELGIDWWSGNPFLSNKPAPAALPAPTSEVEELRQRVRELEARLSAAAALLPSPPARG